VGTAGVREGTMGNQVARPVAPSNKGMKLAKPGQLRSFAAYPRCSTDVPGLGAAVSRPMLAGGVIGLCCLALVGVGCAKRSSAIVDDVREAVFREQLRFWLDENARLSQTVVCLSVEDGGVDRSVASDYLARFRGERAARRLDDCVARPSAAVERSTGHPAVLVSAGVVTWQSEAEAWVATRYYRSGVISGVRTLRVVREADGWVCLGQVVKDGPL
jgi:hypothetical protein